jgi:antitoxin HicB
MQNRFSFFASLTPDDGGFLVRFRAVPEAITWGANRAEALAMAADCLDEALAARINGDLEIPPPGARRRGDVAIDASALMAAKTALYLALRECGISKSSLARRLGVDEKEVRRLLDPRHASRLSAIADAARALGKRLIIDMQDAA